MPSMGSKSTSKHKEGKGEEETEARKANSNAKPACASRGHVKRMGNGALRQEELLWHERIGKLSSFMERIVLEGVHGRCIPPHHTILIFSV